MEYWESKADEGLILYTDSCHPYRIDLIPPNPIFQHSSIPSFHSICARHSQFSLTWPRGPGFQC